MKEALKLALETLVEMSPSGPIGSEIWHKQMNAIRVAGDALAQPEQEPVALEAVYETIIHWDKGGGKRSRRELARRIVSLYTTPPKRPWGKPLVSLTDERMWELWNSQGDDAMGQQAAIAFARAIEAAHGIGVNT